MRSSPLIVSSTSLARFSVRVNPCSWPSNTKLPGVSGPTSTTAGGSSKRTLPLRWILCAPATWTTSTVRRDSTSRRLMLSASAWTKVVNREMTTWGFSTTSVTRVPLRSMPRRTRSPSGSRSPP